MRGALYVPGSGKIIIPSFVIPRRLAHRLFRDLAPIQGGSPYSTSAKNSMLTTQTANSSFVGLNSDWPADTGANEISGGTPPYARQAITWGAPAAGQVSSATNPTFNVPAGTTVKWVTFWTLVTAGTYEGSAPLRSTKDIPFYAAAATDTFSADNHGFTDGQELVVLHSQASVVPGGITEGTAYFVRDSTTDTFKLALTSGGTAIDLTTDGGGSVVDITPETFGAQGTLQLTTVTLNLLSS